MDFFVFIISGFLLGFISAIPIGAVQIEVARRAVSGHLRSAMMVVFGSFLSDILYGLVAFFGIVPFLKEERVMAVFWLIGGVILIIIGTSVVRRSLKFHGYMQESTHLKRENISFITGLSLSLSNPMMIMWWLLGARILKDLGLVQGFTPVVALSFVFSGGFGLSSYLSTVALTLYKLHRFIPNTILMRVSLFCGILLLLLAGYFVIHSLIYLF